MSILIGPSVASSWNCCAMLGVHAAWKQRSTSLSLSRANWPNKMVRFWQALTKITWSIIGHCSAQHLADPLGFNLGPELIRLIAVFRRLCNVLDKHWTTFTWRSPNRLYSKMLKEECRAHDFNLIAWTRCGYNHFDFQTPYGIQRIEWVESRR